MYLYIARGLAASTIIIVSPFTQPELFSKLSLEEAREKAGDRILLVDATAEWCPPCKMMDRTTWTDERLIEWIDSNGIAIQLDVDEHPDTARELGIRAMPTMIVYKEGEEFGRIVGYRDADQMLDWLQEVQQAERPADVKSDRAPAADREQPGEASEAEDHLAQAREALQAGDHAQATEHYLWLWESIPGQQPEMEAVRTTFIATEIAQLVEAHEPALEEFTRVRDQAENRLREEPSWDDLADWIVLNLRILGEPEPVIAWADRIKGDEAGIKTLRRYSHHLAELFDQHERLDLAGLLHANPMLEVEQMWRQVEMVESPEGAGIFAMMDPMYDIEAMEPDDFEDPQFRDEIQRTARQRFIHDSTKLYASLLAAERHQEAARISGFIRDKAPSPLAELELISAAVNHGLGQREHLNWLEDLRPENQADAEQMNHLREQLRHQLQSQPAAHDRDRNNTDNENDSGDNAPSSPPPNPSPIPDLPEPPGPPSLPPGPR